MSVQHHLVVYLCKSTLSSVNGSDAINDDDNAPNTSLSSCPYYTALSAALSPPKLETKAITTANVVTLPCVRTTQKRYPINDVVAKAQHDQLQSNNTAPLPIFVFTSVKAVSSVESALLLLTDADRVWATNAFTCACVGPATADAAGRAGFKNIMTSSPSSSTAKDLAAEVAQSISSTSTSATFVHFFCGDNAKSDFENVLKESTAWKDGKIVLERHVVYTAEYGVFPTGTTPQPVDDIIASIGDVCNDDACDGAKVLLSRVFVFFSGKIMSAVTDPKKGASCYHALPTARVVHDGVTSETIPVIKRKECVRTYHVCIGPSTQAACEASGVEVHAVAKTPNAESLCEAVMSVVTSDYF
eukprot:PhM_4_TR16485/c0_g1_i1/m.77313